MSLLAPAVAWAAYKWTDADGNVHYTQSPPLDGKAEEIAPPPGVNTRRAERKLKELEATTGAYAEARTQRKEEAAKIVAEAKQRKSNCEFARNNLAQLQSHYRYFTTSEQGERIRAAEDERQQRMQKAQDNIKEFCD